MDAVLQIVTFVCLIGGAFFAVTAGVGILRMPDFYSRAHPAGKSDTLAQMLIFLGLAFQALQHEDLGLAAGIKLIVTGLFLLITAPTAIHAITRAAHIDGLKVWTKEGEQGDQR